MLNGDFQPGEAVVRIKTDMTLPNPALRDWPALRIQDTENNPHPEKILIQNTRFGLYLIFKVELKITYKESHT